jgi:type I restriction enzyme, S subunit
VSETALRLTVKELVDRGVIERPMDGNHGEIHPKGDDFVAIGVPFITAADLRNGRVDVHRCAFIDEKQARSLRKGFAKVGDVLLTHKATIGRTAIVDFVPDGLNWLVLTPQVTYYRVLEPEVLNSRYLKFYFDSPKFQALLAAWSGGGSTRAYLGITKQLELPIAVPPIETQRSIVRILGSLDDKVEQNRRTRQAMEQLAQTIFRAWFVDFEPVKAKAEGATSFPSMPNPLFDTLPTRFVDSVIGPVPEGWRVGTVSDMAELSKTQVKPQECPDEIFDHYSLPAFDSGESPVTEPGNAIKSNKFLVSNGCVLLSKLNPRLPRVWLPPPLATRRQIASTEFLVFLPRAGHDRNYLYCQFKQREFSEDIAQSASGTSNSHQRVRPIDLLEKQVVLPSEAARTQFAGTTNALFGLLESNRAESQKLSEMQDYLLPKLLSGDVRVSIGTAAEAQS